MLKLTDRVQKDIIKDQKALNHFYRMNLNEFTQKINSDANLIQVILDYNSAISLLQIKGVQAENTFNQHAFGHLLAKIKDLGLPCWTSSNAQFKLLLTYLAKEAYKLDPVYEKDVLFIFSDEFIAQSGYKAINTFYTGVNHFADIFVNTNHYGKTMIMQGSKVGDTYIDDFAKLFDREMIVTAIREFQTILDNIILEILETGDYRK